MAEALKTFREGEDILASETNENNQYLLSKLSDNAAQVQSYVEGEVATIKSNVASVQATLQNNIDLVKELVRQAYNDLAPDWNNKKILERGTEYTAETNGWLICSGYLAGYNWSMDLYVNGVSQANVYYHGGGGSSYGIPTLLPIAKGDTYKFTGGGATGFFVPCKGDFKEEV